MKTGDLIGESLLNLRRRPLRVTFAAGGVAVGALAVALLLSLGAGLHNFVEAQTMAFSDPVELDVFPEPKASVSDILSFAMGQMGTPARPLEEERKEQMQIMKSFRNNRPRFTPEQIAAIRGLKGVALIEMRQRAWVHSISLEGQQQRFRGDLRPTYSGPQIPLVAGRPLDPSKQSNEAIVAWQWIEAFGLKSPKELLGKQISLAVSNESRRQRELFLTFEKDSKAFKELSVVVVGITGETIASRAIFISRSFSEKLSNARRDLVAQKGKQKKGAKPGAGSGHRRAQSGRDNPQKKGPRSLIIRADSRQQVATVKAALIKKGHGVVSLEDRLGVIGRIFMVIDAVLASVGIVAFLVASLGIANTLIMAVHERTAEIGLWKAIGTSNQAVGLMFSLEAAAMGALGGVMGIGAALVLGLIGNAIAAKYFLQNVVGYEVFVFPSWLIFSTIALSMTVSLLAGILPARRAARLAPVAALRRDA
jgi:putative ABC transport system permease protein